MSEKTILHNLLYILIFGCLFLYIGLKRSSMSNDRFKQLFLFGIFLVIFFFVKIFIITDPDDNNASNFIYMVIICIIIHIIICIINV